MLLHDGTMWEITIVSETGIEISQMYLLISFCKEFSLLKTAPLT